MTKNKKYESDEEDFPEVKVKHGESMLVVADIIKHVKARPNDFLTSLPVGAITTNTPAARLAKLDEILIDLAQKFDLSPDLVKPGEAHRRQKRTDEFWLLEARAPAELGKRKAISQGNGAASKTAKLDPESPTPRSDTPSFADRF
ncbi:uncharacterized protein LOC62_03G003618 [Vanrija pseudolonga]|uniref:Uncharacterized protein n=1 Tax=Vanrija pseudolonga TaxID=143232 RepID=A0AAF0Y506_9TREE|nr:hypothetical protein LOC62_03G003618 [Vanrija pseudolonga]